MASERMDTGAGDVVTISLRGDTMLGIVVDPDRDGSAAVIRGWDRLPNGKFGPVQKHGGVHIGDVLFSINDISLVNMSFAEAKAMLTDTNVINKVLKFSNSKEHYSKKRNLGIESAIASKDSMKTNFLSIIKQARVNEAGKKYAEYEVACSLRVPASIQRDRIVKWSVWKRYSDFETLDAALRRDLGWQMDAVEFPSSHSLAFNKFSSGFIEQRRLDLNAYWQQIIVIDKVVDFSKHHCSADLKAFLDVDAQIAAHRANEGSSGGDNGDGSAADDSPAASEARAPLTKRSSARRQSLTQSGSRRNIQRSSSNLTTTSEAPAAQAPAPSSPTAPANQPPPPAAARPPPPAAKAAPPAPPPPKTAAAAPPAPELLATGKIPPKPTGARANLLGDIAKLRKG